MTKGLYIAYKVDGFADKPRGRLTHIGAFRNTGLTDWYSLIPEIEAYCVSVEGRQIEVCAFPDHHFEWFDVSVWTVSACSITPA